MQEVQYILTLSRDRGGERDAWRTLVKLETALPANTQYGSGVLGVLGRTFRYTYGLLICASAQPIYHH